MLDCWRIYNQKAKKLVMRKKETFHFLLERKIETSPSFAVTVEPKRKGLSYVRKLGRATKTH